MEVCVWPVGPGGSGPRSGPVGCCWTCCLPHSRGWRGSGIVHCAGEGIRGQSEHHHVSSPSPPVPRLAPKLVFLHLWFLFLCCLNPHLPRLIPLYTCPGHSDPSHPRATGAKAFLHPHCPHSTGPGMVTWPSLCKLSWPHPQAFSLWLPCPSQEGSFMPASGARAAVGPHPCRFPRQREELRHCPMPSPIPPPDSPDWPASLGSCSTLGRGLCGCGREAAHLIGRPGRR